MVKEKTEQEEAGGERMRSKQGSSLATLSLEVSEMESNRFKAQIR